jgi:hypothetical protein
LSARCRSRRLHSSSTARSFDGKRLLGRTNTDRERWPSLLLVPCLRWPSPSTTATCSESCCGYRRRKSRRLSVRASPALRPNGRSTNRGTWIMCLALWTPSERPAPPRRDVV